ncbi:hypothetical protein Acy02nite_90620 [Actinoplanes cyaneus]|uniref:Uncharacterized protein n=1 Tax=Actinoplanes cyaneus TaxID=52696 RepID=A0A919MHD9_9ACTN|nr:hypothetical protein Acy02nite_90620 [Actinoplanes cyaneus]
MRGSHLVFPKRSGSGSGYRVALTATWAEASDVGRRAGLARLSEVGRGSVFGVVTEPEPDGVVDRDAVEVGRGNEPHVGRKPTT